MALDKAITSGKEHRKPYRRAKMIDRWCRNHGKCDWCTNQRLFARVKKEQAAKQDLEEADMKESIETRLSRLTRLYTEEIVQMEHCAYEGDHKGELSHKEIAESIQWAIDYVERHKEIAERIQWAIDYVEEQKNG